MEATSRRGVVLFAGKSDAAIVSGLIALLLRVYSGRTSDEVLATDPVFLKNLGLLEALSTNRGNGIASMARKVREIAASYPPPGSELAEH
jgi:cysteine desulfuration protein SufE